MGWTGPVSIKTAELFFLELVTRTAMVGAKEGVEKKLSSVSDGDPRPSLDSQSSTLGGSGAGVFQDTNKLALPDTMLLSSAFGSLLLVLRAEFIPSDLGCGPVGVV